MTYLLNLYSKSCDNFLLVGHFNLSPNNSNLKHSMNSLSSNNLIKQFTCFKSASPTCIDLIITNQKKPFYEIMQFWERFIGLSQGNNNDSKAYFRCRAKIRRGAENISAWLGLTWHDSVLDEENIAVLKQLDWWYLI